MTTAAQFRAMQETLTVTVPRANAEAARRMLADAAESERRRVIAAQSARGGIAPTLATVVDGRRGAALASVKPDGFILLEWGYVREVALVAITALRHAGPHVEGDWKNTLTVLADGAEVQPTAIPHMARQVLVIATQPYSRRLEIGRTSRGDPFVLQDDDYRLIERTAKRMASIYRQVARIDFTYVDLEGAHQLTNRGARAGKGGGQVRYPALRIVGWQVI